LGKELGVSPSGSNNYRLRNLAHGHEFLNKIYKIFTGLVKFFL